MSSSIVYMVIIADREQRKSLLSELAKRNCHIINTVYAHGSVRTSSTLLSAFGFVPDEHKIMITCLTDHASGDALLDALETKYNFDKPNTGIAFTIPVEGLSY